MFHFQRWRFISWWSLLLPVSAIVRFWNLTGPRLWYDEINTWWWASLPLDRAIAATAGDVHPPLFYILEWALVHFLPEANPTLVLRLPSALLSLAALPLLYGVARSLKLGNGVTFGASLIMAIAPTQIFYAQEARMYSLLQFELLLGLWAMLSRRWWLFALAMLAALYTHNYGLIYLALFAGLGFVRECLRPISKSHLDHVALSFAGAVIGYAPWSLVLAQQVGAVKNNWWQLPTTLGSFLAPLHANIFGEGLLGMFGPMGEIVVFGLAAFALVRAFRHMSTDSNGLTLAFLSFAPMVAAWAAELVYRPIYLPRALIGTAAPFYLLVAWAVTANVDWFKKLFAWSTLSPLLLVGVLFYYPTQLNFKGGGYITPRVIVPITGDIIYHLNPGTLVQFHLDYVGDLPQYLAPNSAGSLGTLTPATLAAMGVTQAPLDSLQWRRAWVVWSAGPTTALTEDRAIRNLLAHYPHQQVDTLRLPLPNYHLADGGVWLVWK